MINNPSKPNLLEASTDFIKKEARKKNMSLAKKRRLANNTTVTILE